MCCLLCCFKCLSCCGCRNRLLLLYAFFPPIPDRYELNSLSIESSSSKEKDQKTEKASLRTFNFVLLDPETRKPRLIDNPHFSVDYSGHRFMTIKQNQACGVYFHPLNVKSDYLVIFSHGNSTDIGRMFDFFLEFSKVLRINVFAYEYTGYGVLSSQGSASDEKVLDDIHAAYVYAITQLNFPWHKIILYGQSVGSGPSVFLAAQEKFPVLGLILHSPISSGLRMLDINMTKTNYNDLFPNIDIIKFVRCPTFIFHGADDEEVPVEHAKLLRENAGNCSELWVAPGCGHNDIDMNQKSEFYKKLAWFIRELDSNFRGKNEEELYAMNKAYPWPANFNHLYVKKHKEFAKTGVDIRKKSVLNVLSAEEKKNSSGKSSSYLNSFPPEDRRNMQSNKSKSHSFVEMGNSRANSSAAMLTPKLPMISKKGGYTNQISEEPKVEDEERKE